MKALLKRFGALVGRHLPLAGLTVLVVGGVGGYAVSHFHLLDRSDASNQFPANGPAEFLYLDKARVIAYLAQLEGGEFTTVTLTKKLTHGVDGRLTVPNVGAFGGTSNEEDTLARDVTPTAAANYFELLKTLDGEPEGLVTLGLGEFEERLHGSAEVHGSAEGQFVRFESHGLQAPTYLNPYLALRQKTTFATLFPPASRATDEGERKVLRRQRTRAHHFRQRLGKHPRVVFAVQSLYRINEERKSEVPDVLKKLERIRCHRAAVADSRSKAVTRADAEGFAEIAAEAAAPAQGNSEDGRTTPT